MRSNKRVVLAWWLLFLAGIGFVASGIYTVYRGWDARQQVRQSLLDERVTTPEDASIPNARVADDKTALAQAEIIQKHALAATEGKTYAELERTDPRRTTAFQASALRTAMFAAVLAWNVANLVMGIGAFITVVGLMALLAGFLFRPAKARASA